MEWLDRLAAGILAPLAVWVFASGLDDLFLDLTYLCLWLRARLRRRRNASGGGSKAVAEASCCAAAEPDIAIVVPCWQEAGVIERMLDTNLTAIAYHNYEVWLGVYPNDPATIECVVAAQDRFPRIRYVVCPNPGPTTKADCLNAVYEGLRAHEAATGRRYEIILQHDAEDMIHPQSLHQIRAHCARFDMVQVPVFPLRTPLHWLTHGTYCDEFAEFHLKELRVRARLGGFVPSAGVGTAYRREALERLRAAKGGRLFETDSLTEDYVMGLELRRLGCSQALLHAWVSRDETRSPQRRSRQTGQPELVATRAYFPFAAGAAIRQRSRWLTGNALQSWARFGWRAGARQGYWLWRDRKALVGSPASALANLLFFYGLGRWLALQGSLRADLANWLGEHRLLAAVLLANLVFVAWRQLVRAACSLRIYGWLHALSTPVRAPWGNFLNLCATVRALAAFARSRALRRPLQWVKTAHDYPGHEGLAGGRRRLGEILVSMQAVTTQEIDAALQERQANERLGDCLIRRGRLREEQLYQALALQAGLPFARLAPQAAQEFAVRYLTPAVRGGDVMPFAVKENRTLWVAVKQAPSDALRKKLARACRLRLHYVFVTASNFDELQKRQERWPVSIERPPARTPPQRRVRRLRPVMPSLELRVPIPAWLKAQRRLSITLEYRRVR
jgi:adsorption protein B